MRYAYDTMIVLDTVFPVVQYKHVDDELENKFDNNSEVKMNRQQSLKFVQFLSEPPYL